jgi:uncharacterized protein involved in type VI secretion and phage assembly
MSREFENLVVALDEHRRGHYYGKYRGVVTDPNDPEKMGRIKAQVPSIYGDEQDSPWCMPVAVFAGDSHGLLLLPKKGDGVWIEFEAGNISHPLWTGCWWAKGELPDPQGVNQHVLTSPKGLQIVLDDDASKLQLLHPGGAEITLEDSRITIKLGSAQIELSSAGVSVNNGALEVQ